MLHQEIEKLKGRVAIKQRYDNFIGGGWVAPVGGEYFDNITPITGHPICQVARSRAADIELALDAAHKAKDAWGKTSATERANILNKIADRLEANLTSLALVEVDRQRQAHSRDDRRRPAARYRPLPLFRGLHPCAGRIDRRNRPRHGRLPFP